MEKKIETVDEYISQSPSERQEIMHKVTQVIREAAPNAQERMSWGMPTWWQGENLVHFANAKNHIGFYPSPDGITAFAQELTEYKTSKGAVQFPLSKPVPYDLIGAITRWRVQMVESKGQ